MPARFFAKTLRRGGLWVVLGVCPGVFVKWWVAFLGVVLVTFGLVVGACCCVFLFGFVFGYVGYGLVMVWYCVGKRSWFVKSFRYVRWVDVRCLGCYYLTLCGCG